MCVNRGWSTVCWRDHWSAANTAVACHQLGFTVYGMCISPVTSDQLPFSSGNSYKLGLTDEKFPAFISGISCNGNERSLSLCSSAPLSDLSHCSIEVVELYCTSKN